MAVNKVNMMITCIWFLVTLVVVMGCIKDDFIEDSVEPTIQIVSSVDTIAIGETYQFEAIYLNNVGAVEEAALEWSSSAPEVMSISSSGLATALKEGNSTIVVKFDSDSGLIRNEIKVQVGTTTIISTTEKSGSIQTTSSYELTGDFVLRGEGNNLNLTFDNNYRASSALPGLYIYLTNNRNSVANAYEIGKVTIFSGAHSYTIGEVGLNDFAFVLFYCKPFNVKVGDGEIN